MPDLQRLDMFIRNTGWLLERQRRRVRRLEAEGNDTHSAETVLEAIGNSLEALQRSREALIGEAAIRAAHGEPP
jgi:hypothetical protein